MPQKQSPKETRSQDAPAKPRQRRRRRGPKPAAATPPAEQQTAHLPDIADDTDVDISTVTAFAELGLDERLQRAIARVGFTTPTDIQAALIPIALEGRDCLGQARTGTGKTAAFTLPMLQRLKPGGGLQALVLVPTRELASQVDSHIRQFASAGNFHTALLYGGKRMGTQIDALNRNPEIVIGTPGRIMDLMRRKHLSIKEVGIAILDEVDRMLDIGFRDDIRKILKQIEAPHQTIFVSATMEDEIRRLARAFMTDPEEINVSGDELTVENIEHGFVTVRREDKFQSLLGFLKLEVPQLAIVFTNTKHAAHRVAERLRKEGISCQEIHGDLHQSRRERVMQKFRNASIRVLVATDLASRGLDVMEVSHIVNYDIPEDSAAYVHRIGRTARMGQHGYAITFVTPDEGHLLTNIEMLLNQELPRLHVPWLVCTEPPPTAQTTPPEKKEEKGTTGRYSEALRTDPQLEAIGLRPARRTLGSRFRSTRRGRRL